MKRLLSAIATAAVISATLTACAVYEPADGYVYGPPAYCCAPAYYGPGYYHGPWSYYGYYHGGHWH